MERGEKALKKVDFILAGATRSGTKKLHDVLQSHPSIVIHENPHHPNFKKHKLGLADVDKGLLFDVTAQETVDPKNLRTLNGMWEDDARKCAERHPNAKVIFTLRNPVTRAYSQYWKTARAGKETAKTFEQAMEEELSGKRTPETTGRCWIFKSQYQIHLEEWFSRYSPEQIKILVMEEWIDQPQVGLAGLERFLGLIKNSLHDSYEQHTRKASGMGGRLFQPFQRHIGNARISNYPPMEGTTREDLEDIFAVDKLYVANVTGRTEIKAWK